MPNLDVPTGSKFTGWHRDMKNGTLEAYYNGTRVLASSTTATTIPLATTFTLAVTGTTTITAGTGLTVTTGNATVSAGDARITAGNVRLGAISAFATTEPTSAVVMKAGTAPSGAITTSGGIFTDGTTVKKIIADGTVSDVQT